MSSDVMLVFYGVRIDADNSPANDRLMGAGQHQAQIAARSVGLDDWWGAEFSHAEKGYLLLGRKLGLIGFGWETAKEFGPEALIEIFRSVDAKLREASLGDRGRLFVRVESDH